MVKRAINTKTKVALKSSTIIRDLDIYCLKSYCLSNNIILKVQTQETTAKYFSRLKKPKIKDPKSTPPCNNITESAKKKDKQKKFKRQQKRTNKSKKTPTTVNNTINATKKDLKKKHDTNKITCLTYNKKGYYASYFTKPKTQRRS